MTNTDEKNFNAAIGNTVLSAGRIVRTKLNLKTQ